MSIEKYLERILGLFECKTIIMAVEKCEGGFQFHVGTLNRTASKQIVFKKMREVFKEWEPKNIGCTVSEGY